MRRPLLIVDDDPSVRHGLRAVFESMGLRVFEAATAAEAERSLESHEFGVVLLDLSLAGPHGREGLEVLDAARRAGVTAPIVLFTAFGSDALRTDAIARGASDLWSKGLPIEELVRRVHEIAP